MGKSNKYYLIARNRSNNDYDFVCFDGKLENIDLYTTNFENEQELSNELYKNGQIKSNDVDLYIVYSKDNKIITNEVLYSKSKMIKDIANDSLNNELGPSNERVGYLLYDFCHKMGTSSLYYSMVMYGDTNIYNRFVNCFVGKRFQSTYNIKYMDGCWASKSYPLLRNILESYERYNHHIEDNSSERKILDNYLLQKINTNSVNNQLLLFDVLEFKNENLREDNKLIEIFNTFDIVNPEHFIFYDNEAIFVGSNELDYDKKMNCLLDEDLLRLVGFYSLHKATFDCTDKNSDKYYFYKKLIREDKNNIYELLSKNKDKLDNAYEWSLLYLKYNFGLGDEDEYQKRKRYD